MKFLFKSKDGGSESTVTGYWLIEAKNLFSVCLLCFDGESREAYHTHAFSAVSWLLWGGLTEAFWNKENVVKYKPSLKPIKTPRDRCHKVSSDKGKTWVLSFRGPWKNTWKEFRPLEGNREVILTHGRKEI